MRAPVGSLLPTPIGMTPENRTHLQTDLASLRGDSAIVETLAGGRGQGRQSTPQIEWQPKRLGDQIPESHVTWHSDVAKDVCAVLARTLAVLGWMIIEWL